jgi:hypothetical protein
MAAATPGNAARHAVISGLTESRRRPAFRRGDKNTRIFMEAIMLELHGTILGALPRFYRTPFLVFF